MYLNTSHSDPHIGSSQVFPNFGENCGNEEAREASVVRIRLIQQRITMLQEAWASHPLFRFLPFDEFLKSLESFEIDECKTIYERGRKAQNLYILDEGSVRVFSTNDGVELIASGTWFGEQGLEEGSERLESAITLANTTYWRLRQSTYQLFISRIRENLRPEMIKGLSHFPSLADLPPDKMTALLDHLTPLKFSPGARIVSQGEPGDCLYLITSGLVAVTEDERWKRNLRVGDFFGEQAILYSCVRTATITAYSPCADSPEVTCLRLTEKTLRGSLGNSIYQLLYKNTLRIALDRSPRFPKFSEESKTRLIDSMQMTTYGMEDTVIRAGTRKGQALYIVLYGSLKSKNVDFRVYQCIGDEEIFGPSTEHYEEDFLADYHEVCVAHIGRAALEECLGLTSSFQLGQIPDFSVREIRLFDGLSGSTVADLCATVKLFRYQGNDVVLDEHHGSEKIFIVKSGVFKVYQKGKLVRIHTQYDFFGERNILPDPPKWVTVISEDMSECWVFDKQIFLQVISPAIKTAIRNSNEEEDRVTHLTDLTPVATLDTGTFSFVSLAITRQSQLYSLKCVPRVTILNSNLQQGLLMELNVRLRLNHPFIQRFFKTFQDENCVYFLSEYIPGESFFEVLNQMGTLRMEDAQFYAGELLLALEYLHARKIIYRDLKSENVIVNTDGYLKLVDFGSAKVTEKTNSVIGTPQFMAPEVIMGKQYGSAIDLWSLGVMLFEFLTGGLPFGQLEEDPCLVCEEVLTGRLTFPDRIPADSPVVSLVQQLLSRNPVERGTAEEVKSHPFFSDISFVRLIQDSILNKTEQPPMRPTAVDYSQQIAEARRSRRRWSEVLQVKFT